MPITEREIVEAAKAMFERDALKGYWHNLPLGTKWFWLECAYAALRAARKVRG